MLLEKKVDVNRVTKAGTAISEAVTQGDLEVVEALLKGGADINLSHDEKNPARTPLWVACEEEKVDIIRFLLANGEYGG